FPKVSSDHDNGVAYPDYLDFKRQATTLEGFGTTSTATMILSDGEKPDRYLGSFITADAFSFLGVTPVLGRTFRAEEDRKGATPVALLGYEIWQNHFGSDANMVGRVITINGKRVTVVGVMPKGWRFPEASDLWMPLQIEEKENPRGKFIAGSGSFARARDWDSSRPRCWAPRHCAATAGGKLIAGRGRRRARTHSRGLGNRSGHARNSR